MTCIIDMEPLPVACTLSEEALRERQSTTLEQLFAEAQEIQPIQSGYRFRFEVSDQLLTSILEVIKKERRCCRFMAFKLEVHAAEGPVWLGIRGPEGTREFLEGLFNLHKS